MDRKRLKELEASVDEEEIRAKSGYYNDIHNGYIEAEYMVISPTSLYRKPFFVALSIGIGAFLLCVVLTIVLIYIF